MRNNLLTAGEAEVPSLLHKMAQKCNNDDDNDNHSPFSVNHGPAKDTHGKHKNTSGGCATLPLLLLTQSAGLCRGRLAAP